MSQGYSIPKILHNQTTSSSTTSPKIHMYDDPYSMNFRQSAATTCSSSSSSSTHYQVPHSISHNNNYHDPINYNISSGMGNNNIDFNQHHHHYMAIPSISPPPVGHENNLNGANTLNNRLYNNNSQNSCKSTPLRSAKSTSALNSSSATELPSSSSIISSTPTSPSTYLDENELYQIERFYMAHKTFVYVSRCMANLYFTKSELTSDGHNSSPSKSHEWQLERTGVPVIIFDKGETKARSKRQLRICLAERGTGFNLWSDIIDNLTDYKAMHPCFHTLYLSADHRQMAGLSFDSNDAAKLFLHQIESITSDPLNIALSGPKRMASKKDAKSKSKSKRSPIFKLPSKDAISSPCLFQHVINVDIKDFDKLYSIASLVPHHVYTDALVKPQLRSLNCIHNSAFHSISPSPVASTASENSSNFSV